MTKAKELAYDIVGSLGRNGYLDNSITCKDATDRIANSIQQYADQQAKELTEEVERLKSKKLFYQLFIGKVSDEIGVDKTSELLKESINNLNTNK